MAQILDSIPEGQESPILCSYINATSQIQIARITNIPNWYFERVVFPGQRLIFEALPEALLEIHTGAMASAILSDTIHCHRLRVKEDGDVGEELIERKSDENSGDRFNSESSSIDENRGATLPMTTVVV
jgi:hypothetical protein